LSDATKQGFLKLIVPLLLHRTDAEVTVSERVRIEVVSDLRIRVDPLPVFTYIHVALV
jgi:hypothetical protein